MWVAACDCPESLLPCHVRFNAPSGESENKLSLTYHFFESPRDRDAVKRKFARISLVSWMHDRRSIAHLRNEWMTPALNITKSLCIFVESVDLIGHPLTYVSETLEIDHFQKYLSHKG